MAENIIWLQAPAACDPARTGNKGANLGRLTRQGLPVPGGFCVTVAAYQRFVDANHLTALLSPGRFRDGTAAQLGAWCEAARAAVLAAPIPADIGQDVAAAYAELTRARGAEPAVAVRSSSTVEDLGEGSFAGVFGTSLNVTGAAAVLEHARQSWATLWSPAAITWLVKSGLAPADYAMAVVVQPMVKADVAGVMFTAHPVTGHPHEIVINAALGLGEGVVSGAVESDTIVVNAIELRVASTVVAPKRTRLIATAAGGLAEESVATEAAAQPALTPVAAVALAKMGLELQRRFGGPQDIEWALEGGQAFILQTRDVTARPAWFPLPERVDEAPAITSWTLEFPDHFSPFGRSLERRKNPIYRGAAAAMLGVPITNTQAAIHGFIYQHEIVGAPGWLPAPALKAVQLVRWLRRAGAEERVFREQAIPRLAARLQAVRAKTVLPATPRARLGTLEEAVAAYLEFEAAAVPVGVLANAFTTVVMRLCTRALRGCPVEPATLLLGLPNATSTRDEELAELAVALRVAGLTAALDEHDGDLASAIAGRPEHAAIAATWRRFHATYGYVWSDRNPKDPSWIVNADFRRTFLRQPPRVRPERADAAAQAEQAYREIAAQLTQGLRRRVLPVEKWLLDYFLPLARRYYPCREDYNHHLSSAVMVIGETLRTLGRELVARGALEEVEHIFTLSYDELVALPAEPGPGVTGPLADAARRFREAQGQRHLRPPVAFTLGTPAVAAVAAPDGQRLTGAPGSPGIAVGRARLARRAELSRVQAGEILVCDTVRPEWSPVLMIIGGLVTDRGYVLSHGANLARESGIPAVLGTGRATEIIKDGDLLRVDGTAGLVWITSSEANANPTPVAA